MWVPSKTSSGLHLQSPASTLNTDWLKVTTMHIPTMTYSCSQAHLLRICSGDEGPASWCPMGYGQPAQEPVGVLSGRCRQALSQEMSVHSYIFKLGINSMYQVFSAMSENELAIQGAKETICDSLNHRPSEDISWPDLSSVPSVLLPDEKKPWRQGVRKAQKGLEWPHGLHEVYPQPLLHWWPRWQDASINTVQS